MSYTPGPWQMLQEEKGQNDLSRRVHGKAPVYRVESANGGHWFIGYFRKKKDARLAAAAPELLEVCEALLALNNTLVVELSESDWLKYRREAERKAKAALAKARGVEVEGE